jgi:uncharacterized membrane protein
MGFFSQKGLGLLAAITSIIIADVGLWSLNISEVQKYFGILALMMLFMFIFLLIVIDYQTEELKKEMVSNLGKQSSRKKL